MASLFDIISKNSFQDELQKIANYPFQYPITGMHLADSNENPEEDDGLGFVFPMLAGTAGGAGLLGALSLLNKSVGNRAPFLTGSTPGNIIAGAIGGAGLTGTKLLIDYLTRPNTDNSYYEE